MRYEVRIIMIIENFLLDLIGSIHQLPYLENKYLAASYLIGNGHYCTSSVILV